MLWKPFQPKLFLALTALLLLFPATPGYSQEKPEEFAAATDADGNPISPSGRPAVEKLKDESARVMVWHDAEGWHLRTTTRAGRLAKFTGEVRLESTTFTKFRTVGLERKAKNPDRWEMNTERTAIRFEISTAGSFDGFDFEISDPRAAVAFDLNVGGKPQPKRLFIGGKMVNPASTKFSLTE